MEVVRQSDVKLLLVGLNVNIWMRDKDGQTFKDFFFAMKLKGYFLTN